VSLRASRFLLNVMQATNYNHSRRLAGRFVDLEVTEEPTRVFYPLRILATAEGIVLHHSAHGWFIQNGNLAAWREERGN